MIKKEHIYTNIKLTYQSPDEKEWFIIYNISGDEKTIQVGTSYEDASKNERLPYEMFKEITSVITEESKKEIGLPRYLRSPVVDDCRPEGEKEKESSTKDQATEIQNRVNESMKQINEDEEMQPLGSFSSIEENPDDEDPTGISIEDLGQLGKVPDTPKEFKKQMEEIQQQRANAPVAKGSSKRIIRKED